MLPEGPTIRRWRSPATVEEARRRWRIAACRDVIRSSSRKRQLDHRLTDDPPQLNSPRVQHLALSVGTADDRAIINFIGDRRQRLAVLALDGLVVETQQAEIAAHRRRRSCGVNAVGGAGAGVTNSNGMRGESIRGVVVLSKADWWSKRREARLRPDRDHSLYPSGAWLILSVSHRRRGGGLHR
jgi:hypothetical protein